MVRTELEKMAIVIAHGATLSLPIEGHFFEVVKVRGQECLSGLFEFTVDFVPRDVAELPDGAIDPSDLIGQPASLEFGSALIEGEGARDVHGLIREFTTVPYDQTFALQQFRIKIVPFLRLWDLNVGYRMFEELTIVDIVSALCDEWGVEPVFHLSRSYPAYKYRCQYEESDYNFLARVLEEEGIAFFFQHSSTEHSLVLSDNELGFEDQLSIDSTYNKKVTHWQTDFSLRFGKHTICGFDVQQGDTFDRSESTVVGIEEIERFESKRVTNKVFDSNQASRAARVAMERSESRFEIHRAKTVCSELVAGGRFQLVEHPALPLNRTYLVTSISHAWDKVKGYRNAIECTPVEPGLTYRPPRRAARPSVRGPQSAVVVSESPDPDEYGAVQVRFPWNQDDHCVAWIRVAEMSAGSSRGTWFPPRVDDEVLVEFVNGDPDRPVITGRMYNGLNLPTETDPKVTAITTETGQQLRFDDTENSQKLLLHASKDVKVFAEGGEILIDNNTGSTVKISPSGEISISASSQLKLDAASIKLSSGMVEVNAGFTKFSGVVQCSALIANSVVSSTYTPGAGNIW